MGKLIWNSVYDEDWSRDEAWFREYLGAYRDLVDVNLYYGFPKEPMPTHRPYRLYNGNGAYISSHETEAEAVRTAESFAKSNPGVTYYVYKAITRSYQAPAPALTTRL